ncbi:DUF131 domain-containing protein [Candidatus Woesearchaeota archaeon]|nr:DUF131 domain-containing protein [Candidatus Woesearchaeota archaeon]
MPLKMEQFVNIGILMIIVGFALVFFGALMGSKEGASSKTKVAVGGFIGFIPFGFGNDKRMVWFVTILSLVIFLVWMFLSFRFAK